MKIKHLIMIVVALWALQFSVYLLLVPPGWAAFAASWFPAIVGVIGWREVTMQREIEEWQRE